MDTTDRPEGLRPGHLDRGWARGLSFLLAAALSVLILVYPKALASGIADVRHGLLSLLMWGVAAGFVHGVGYTPVRPILRVLLGPYVGWPLMLGGIAWVLARG